MVKGEQAGVDAEYEAASEVVHRVLGILDIHLIGEGTMVNVVLEVVLLDLQSIPLHVRGKTIHLGPIHMPVNGAVDLDAIEQTYARNQNVLIVLHPAIR